MHRQNKIAFGEGRLGFGCAGLHGAVSTREAAAIIEFALDSGITHFDTARVYGWGAAESMVGEVAQRRRDEMVIISKAGIMPPTLAGRAMKKIAGRFSPKLRAAGEAQFGAFTPDAVTRSVEQSLAALRTDHLDALMLHEVEPEHITDDLKQTLHALKQSGKTRRLGISASLTATNAIEAKHPDLCEVIEVAALAVESAPRPPVSRPRIIHSALGARLTRFSDELNADPRRAKRFTAETGCDPADKSALARLLLLLASREGMVLFSSVNRDHIAANATLLAANDTDALRGFTRFLAAA